MSYGKIYETTWWGNPVRNGWGGIYYDLSVTDDPEFRFTVKTDNAGTSNNDQFTLPLASSFNGVTAEVDWGDGNSDTITAFDQSEITHTYSSSGTYTIKITNAIRGFKFNNGGDKLKILDLQNYGVLDINEDRSFSGCENLTQSATDAPTISATNINSTFKDCDSFNGNISNWDVSSVTNMSTMFRNDVLFNQPIGSWNVGNVTNMNNMLRDCDAFDQDLSSWNIVKVSSANSFMFGTPGLSVANYDALLIGWEATLQSEFPNGSGYSLSPSWQFGSSQYTGGGAAATARASLVSNYNWTIVDGGTA